MAPFIALFTRLCGIREKTRPLETSPLETAKREETSDNLENKETGASYANITDANPELPLPPARKAALRETYSCNDMMLQKSGSCKKKLEASLTIKMPRASSMAQKRDGEEDKSVRKKRLKAENSILVRPIILGEKCRVLDEEEGDEDYSQRMPKHRIFHPRSLSSISFSRTNSKIDLNVISVKETSEDSIKSEGK